MPSRLHAAVLGGFYLLAPAPTLAADWPMWRHDAGRTGASRQELPGKLHLQWMREFPPLKPAWPDQAKMQFDAHYEPVVMGSTLFVGSPLNDSLTALDTRDGSEKWRFFTDGPIRFAPVAWQGKVYFTSDDGHLYCVDAGKGTLLWKFRGAPADRRILGNERLISTWPARGAPVIADGTVYFAASIWPFMGIFIHALDATTGEVRWTNDGDGSIYIKQPHNADSFAGVAPQGPMVVAGDRLLIPGGRSVPACYDRTTGKLLRYQLAENGKKGGGHDVTAFGNVFFNGGGAFDLDTEKYLGDIGKPVIATEDFVFAHVKGVLSAYDRKTASIKEEEKTDRLGKKSKAVRWLKKELASYKLAATEDMILAGSRIYAASDSHITALDFQREKGFTLSSQATVEGKLARLIAADDRLFAVTSEGRIYCFGGEAVKPVQHTLTRLPAEAEDAWTAKAKTILDATKPGDAYCVAWGVGSGRLVSELARQSQLRIIVIETDAKKVEAFRERWVQAGLYGSRIAIHTGDALSVPLPPYLASVMVSEDWHATGIAADGAALSQAFQVLRPFGGTICLPSTVPTVPLKRLIADAKLANAEVKETNGLVLLSRHGALPGSANWTHEHADPANTRVSKDILVKAPLGVLWFGGPSHDGILPRHGHGPQPQVIDGRLIIEGVDMLRAMDIYTGKILWETRLPGVGQFYNNLAHQPGANASGSNFVSTPDGIYIAHGTNCIRLDPATGNKMAAFKLPAIPGVKENSRWGYINVAGDFLIGGADPIYDPKLDKLVPKGAGDDPDPAEKKKDDALTKLLKLIRTSNDNLSASKHLVVMDRHTGKVLWTASARLGFRHNATSIGGGRLYTIDRLSGPQLSAYKRRGEEPPCPPRIVAFDLQTGKVLWSADADIFGTWLSYSAKHDMLFEAGRVARDTLFDEPKGVRAYRADKGTVVWYDKAHVGPAMVHGDTLLLDQSACDLLTGKAKMREDPLTGEMVPWKWTRNYGCNTPAASEHLLTFRSGAAGYFDYCNDGGTGNFGGFRSSCTNNLIVAGGVLTAPDYTRTCTCQYQNQTSLALVHMPEAEMWTSFGTKDVKGRIRRLGINLGAPGDRKAEDGTLWLEYPSVAGTSPTISVTVSPANVQWFRRHASQVQGKWNWVAASGAKGLSSLTVDLGKAGECKYTVRLHFSEPDRVQPGERLFHVSLQGKEVLRHFDIIKEAGASNRALVREFTGIAAAKELVVRLTPAPGARIPVPVLCGIEIVAENGE